MNCCVRGLAQTTCSCAGKTLESHILSHPRGWTYGSRGRVRFHNLRDGGRAGRQRAEAGARADLHAVVDRVIALTGYVGDHTIYRQLQVHECWTTSGPMKLSAALLASSYVDCLDQTSQGADTLRNPEPDFFILGAKSYGRNSTFLMWVGWEQVGEVLSLLGGTPTQ